jgi:hypothetical protein
MRDGVSSTGDGEAGRERHRRIERPANRAPAIDLGDNTSRFGAAARTAGAGRGARP